MWRCLVVWSALTIQPLSSLISAPSLLFLLLLLLVCPSTSSTPLRLLLILLLLVFHRQTGRSHSVLLPSAGYQQKLFLDLYTVLPWRPLEQRLLFLRIHRLWLSTGVFSIMVLTNIVWPWFRTQWPSLSLMITTLFLLPILILDAYLIIGLIEK